MRREDILPPYWINMGAMAISTLGGTVLLAAASDSRLLRQLVEFVTGSTLLFWATATWWIPFLLLLGIWRHGVQRVSITYDPAYWSMVFPLGMYSACTWRLSLLLDLPILLSLANAFVYVSLVAWTAAFVGLILRLAGMRQRIRSNRYNSRHDCSV